MLIDVADTCLAGYYDRDLTDVMSKNLEEHGIQLALGKLSKRLLVMARLKS
ncbi:hypothetical protein KP754_03590 [Streptococcus equi subsp. equi]|nr:hypothetical protein [Streptococcus equi subsp. equi]